MRTTRFSVKLIIPVLLALVSPLDAGEEPQLTLAAEMQAHITRLQNAPDIHPLFRSRLLKILPQIAEGASVDVILPGCKGNTALHYACAISDVDLVSTLLRHGADTGIRTQRGARPTDCADGPNRARIRHMLEHPEPGKLAKSEPELPPAEKTESKQEPVLSPLPATKPEPANQATTPEPRTAAPKSPGGQPEISQVIDHLRNIPCAGPAEYHHKEALLLCLTRIQDGKPIDNTPTGSGGNTALHHACAMGDFFMAIWLLEHGATPTLRNNSGHTPMDCLQGPNASFIRTHLIEYGAKN